jgi:hypothetical protein
MKTCIKGKSKAKHKNIIRASSQHVQKPNDPPLSSKTNPKHLLMLHHR